MSKPGKSNQPPPLRLLLCMMCDSVGMTCIPNVFANPRMLALIRSVYGFPVSANYSNWIEITSFFTIFLYFLKFFFFAPIIHINLYLSGSMKRLPTNTFVVNFTCVISVVRPFLLFTYFIDFYKVSKIASQFDSKAINVAHWLASALEDGIKYHTH